MIDTMSPKNNLCGLCNKEVQNDSITKRQTNCKGKYEDWYCINCKNIFPFQNVEDGEFELINKGINYKLLNIYNKCSSLKFEPYGINDYNECDFQKEIDPNNNFYKNINTNSKYLTVDECNHSKSNMKNKISFIHINARNLKANFSKIENLLNEINIKFDIIAISETWLEQDDSQESLLKLEGYTLNHITRVDRKGGGVAIYVHNSLDYKNINVMSMNVNGIMECISVELCISNRRNIIVNCTYRTPGSDLQIFTEHIELMLKKVNNKKSIFLCGDLNIDLLKYNDNKGTKTFVDMMFSIGLYPLIDKPTRITDHSATLIDNIFTNELDHNISSGLLISDISDHLPIFAICKYSEIKRTSIKKYTFTRKSDENCIIALKNELLVQDWNNVMDTNDVNSAYDNFIKTFVHIYNKHCPVNKVCAKDLNNKTKPWITNGLRNACKKKNNLYRKYLQCRTKIAENKYKTYKNKLTSILRVSEKSYYNKLLAQEKNNIKGTWKILNTIIRKKQEHSPYPDKFKSNGKTITKKKDIANGFNDFFVNVGPNLAKNIKTHNRNIDVLDFLEKQNPVSMFLSDVEESEIIKMVNNCKSKKSTGYDNIDMAIIKQVIYYIVKPFTHICNSSFKNGVFPNKMKIAKVIPI